MSGLEDAAELVAQAVRSLDRATAMLTAMGKPGYASWSERTANEACRLLANMLPGAVQRQ